jgi:hypothetical protein
MPDNKIIYKCPKCSKIYKGKTAFNKHVTSCKSKESSAPIQTIPISSNIPVTAPTNSNPSIPTPTPSSQKPTENNYDINMTFGEGNKVHVDMKKQPTTGRPSVGRQAAGGGSSDEETDSDEESGETVLKDLLRPKVSETYQEEIDKLENLIKMFKHLPVSDDPSKKDHVIDQLKATITILMTQAQSLIKEMKQMSRRNSYYKNNIMLATFILDKCRMDAPETEEEFENMFGENVSENKKV